MRESYYAVVNGYKDLFIDPLATEQHGEDRFLKGTTFEEIYQLFCLDRELRSIFLPQLLVVETTLKTIIVHAFCERFPSRNSYLELENYRTTEHGKQAARKVVRNLHYALEVKSQRHNKDFIDHYLSKHKHVPLWVLANFLSFGQISKFFSALDESTQASACKTFGEYSTLVHGKARVRIEPRYMRHLLRQLADFRNICAHEERLYCIRLGKTGDIQVSDLVRMMRKILPPENYRKMVLELADAIESAGQNLSTINVEQVLHPMGLQSVDEIRVLGDR